MVLVKIAAARQIVARCCERSAAAGVREGMTLTHARALLMGTPLRVHPYDPLGDEAALKALARWAVRCAPLVAPDPPDGLLMDVSGCRPLYGNEQRLVNTFADRIGRLGFRARVACASTFGCAWAVARFSDQERSVIAHGQEHQALTPLPIEALRIDEDTAAALLEVGIERIGHLFALPRRELVARFGSHLLLRMDQATGETIEVIQPQHPVEPPSVQRVFDGPVTQLEAVMRTVRELTEDLAGKLQRLESGVRQLDIVFDRLDVAALRVLITLSRPSRDVKHLWSLLKPKVETIHMGFGIERIALTATVVGRLRHEQIEQADGQWRSSESDDDAPADRAFGELIDTLAQRLGPHRTVCVHPVESHLPERSFRQHSVMQTQRAQGDAKQITASDRPSILLERPEPIDVMAITPEGPPSWLRWRGEEHRIVTAIGPERIGNVWWSTDVSPTCHSQRDYFKVQDGAGRWLWVYREREAGRWFAHGEWA